MYDYDGFVSMGCIDESTVLVIFVDARVDLAECIYVIVELCTIRMVELWWSTIRMVSYGGGSGG